MMNDQELDQILDGWQAPSPSPSLRQQVCGVFSASERGRILGVQLRWIVAGILSAGFVALATEALVDGRLGGEASGGGDSPSGPIYGRVIQMVEPPVARLGWLAASSGMSFGETTTGIRGSSWICDRPAGLFYGVEFTVNRLPDGRFQAATGSLIMERLQRGPFQVTGQVVPLPANSGPAVVSDRQPFDVDIYRSGGTRIFARIWISSQPFARRPLLPAPGMQFNSAKLYRNGVELMAWPGSDASGVSVWFRMPGQGRYVMALDPDGNSNFAAAGQVNGNLLEFHAGNDVYRLESAQAITSGGARTVYVWHDSGFESELKASDQEIMFGSSGRACIFISACK